MLVIRQGNLAVQRVDCVVNPANGRLKHGGGVARALADAGGEEYVAASNRYVKQFGEIPEGEAALTQAGGTLACKAVIHAVGPVWNEKEKVLSCRMLALTVKNALNLAVHHRFVSVAMPAISSGIFGFPKALSARIIVDQVAAFFKAGACGSVRLVALTNIDMPTCQFFCSAALMLLPVSQWSEADVRVWSEHVAHLPKNVQLGDGLHLKGMSMGDWKELGFPGGADMVRALELDHELLRTPARNERVAGCGVVLCTERNGKRMVCGGREVAGDYAGYFNIACGKHDPGERRIDTMAREFYEEMGMHMNHTLNETDILSAPKVMVGKTIVALIMLDGVFLSRRQWNMRAAEHARKRRGQMGGGLNEMDMLELFDAETFPCGGDSAVTVANSKQVSNKVKVSPFFVSCVNAFKVAKHLPSIRCEFFDKEGGCRFGSACRNLHDHHQALVENELNETLVFDGYFGIVGAFAATTGHQCVVLATESEVEALAVTLGSKELAVAHLNETAKATIVSDWKVIGPKQMKWPSADKWRAAQKLAPMTFQMDDSL